MCSVPRLNIDVLFQVGFNAFAQSDIQICDKGKNKNHGQNVESSDLDMKSFIFV